MRFNLYVANVAITATWGGSGTQYCAQHARVVPQRRECYKASTIKKAASHSVFEMCYEDCGTSVKWLQFTSGILGPFAN
eukprot:559237-Pelagomonas_calceolata.AAC.1